MKHVVRGQALGPVLQEMGDLNQGHAHQSDLQLRLASIAAAPWTDTPPSPSSPPSPAGKATAAITGKAGDADAPSPGQQGSDDERAARKLRATELWGFCWRGVFEVHEGVPQGASFRFIHSFIFSHI